jgi:hypothetical protein
MKTHKLIMILLISLISKAGLSQTITSDSIKLNSTGVMSKLLKTAAKPNLLYNRTIKWINSTYQNPDKIIVGQQINQSVTISGYKSDVFKNYGMLYHIYFTIQDSLIKYKFTIDELKYESPGASPSANVPLSFFYKKDGSIKPSAQKAIIKIEQDVNQLFLSYIEQLNNSTMTSDEAIAELKKGKDKLDLGIISQTEFDKLKEELLQFIK